MYYCIRNKVTQISTSLWEFNSENDAIRWFYSWYEVKINPKEFSMSDFELLGYKLEFIGKVTI